MNLENIIIFNLFAIIIAIIIFIHSQKTKDTSDLPTKLYSSLIAITILMLIVDVLARFDGRPDTLFPLINQVGNFSLFLLTPVLVSVWVIYIYSQLYPNLKNIKKLIIILLIVNLLHLLFLIISLSTGWVYYFEEDINRYHRGPLYFIHMIIDKILLIVSIVMLFINRKKIEKRYMLALLSLPIFPAIGTVLQMLFYGYSFALQGIVLALLIIFINIQNQNMHTDYLTGLYNRKRLDSYLNEKMNYATKNKTFSGIIIDLNDFKSINDTFGHEKGDQILKQTAKILKKSLRPNDFIARYGGDEFFVVLDISNWSYLEEVVSRIKGVVDKYNQDKLPQYQIRFSMGYGVYDKDTFKSLNHFLRHLDQLMYEKKRIYKDKKK